MEDLRQGTCQGTYNLLVYDPALLDTSTDINGKTNNLLCVPKPAKQDCLYESEDSCGHCLRQRLLFDRQRVEKEEHVFSEFNPSGVNPDRNRGCTHNRKGENSDKTSKDTRFPRGDAAGSSHK